MNDVKQLTHLERFEAAFFLGIANIAEAARIYVEAIDENPNMAFDFQAKFSDFIPASAWAGFEAVGRKWMHPKLLMGGGGRHSNKIKRLPYSTQEQILSGSRFDFLVANGESIKVDPRELSQEQAKQLFGENHIRTLSEQRAYLASEEKASMSAEDIVKEARQMPYIIRGKKIIFRESTEMTLRELKIIIAEM